MIRIGIVDAHAITRAGLIGNFAVPVEFRVTGQGSTVDDALALAHSGEVDVLVMDLQHGRGTALESIAKIRGGAADVRVLVLSDMPEDVFGPALLSAGATGYLSKCSEIPQILQAVREVAAGRLVASEVVRRAMKASPTRHHALSTREMEVFVSLAKGKRLSMVAAAMKVSVKTASTYRARILKKMAMESNPEMTRYAMALGLIA